MLFFCPFTPQVFKVLAKPKQSQQYNCWNSSEKIATVAKKKKKGGGGAFNFLSELH